MRMIHGVPPRAAYAVLVFFLVLAGCRSPVTSPQTVSSGATTYPLGKNVGISVYAGTDDGYGVLEYSSTSTHWASLDWSSLGYSWGNYPAVHGVAVSGGLVYAATDDGLIYGSGTSWNLTLGTTALTSVAVSSNTVFVTGASGSGVGLEYASAGGLSGSWTSLIPASTDVITQWVPVGGSGPAAAVAAGVKGLYSASSATGPYSAVGSLDAGTINGAYYDSAGTTLYVGTTVGISYTSGSSFSWNSFSNLGGGVNGIAQYGTVIVAGTTTGIAWSLDNGAHWLTGTLYSAARAVVPGMNASTFYVADGASGLGILTLGSSGSASWDAVLTGVSVSTVCTGP